MTTPVRPPTPDEVRALAAREFGGELRSARRIDDGGERIATFDVDDRFILKFALGGAGARELVTEATVLPAVAATSPIDVPRIDVVGERRGLPFIGYPKIAGRSGEDLRPKRPRWEGLAEQLGGFLSAVHALPQDLSPRPPSEHASSALAELPALAETIERDAADLVTDAMRPYLRGEVPEPPPAERFVFCHGDIKGEHMLIAPSGWRLVGVVDWGDACAADPAVDLGGLATWLGPPFVRMVVDRYVGPAEDEGLFDRAITLARAGMLRGLGRTLRGDETWPYVRAQIHAAFLER
jgi:aminoglycoside phosphotransferase (APT) family kinase protein